MHRMIAAAFSLAVASAALGFGQTPALAAPANKPQIGAWGVDLAGRDLSVKPGDDFFNYANGTWLANTQIPADRTRWGHLRRSCAKS